MALSGCVRRSHLLLLYLLLKADKRSHAGDLACEGNFTREAASQIKLFDGSDS